MAKEIKHVASAEAMTLRELAEFVEDAQRSGGTGNETISADITFGGKLKGARVSVTPTHLGKADQP